MAEGIDISKFDQNQQSETQDFSSTAVDTDHPRTGDPIIKHRLLECGNTIPRVGILPNECCHVKWFGKSVLVETESRVQSGLFTVDEDDNRKGTEGMRKLASSLTISTNGFDVHVYWVWWPDNISVDVFEKDGTLKHVPIQFHNLAINGVKGIALGSSPTACVFALTNNMRDLVYIFDEEFAPIKTIESHVCDRLVLNEPTYVTWGLDINSVYVTNRRGKNTSVVHIHVGVEDPTSSPKLLWITKVEDPWNVQLICGKLYVTHHRRNGVTVLNPTNGEIQRTIDCPGIVRCVYSDDASRGEITIVSYGEKRKDPKRSDSAERKVGDKDRDTSHIKRGISPKNKRKASHKLGKKSSQNSISFELEPCLVEENEAGEKTSSDGPTDPLKETGQETVRPGWNCCNCIKRSSKENP